MKLNSKIFSLSMKNPRTMLRDISFKLKKVKLWGFWKTVQENQQFFPYHKNL